MLKGDASTTGKWVVLFNFHWEPELTISGKQEKSFLHVLAQFDTEEEADIFIIGWRVNKEIK